MTDPTAQIDRIVEVFGRLDVEVRDVSLGGSGGGFCTVRGKRIVLLDRDADEATRLDCCIAALAAVPEAESIYLSPELREAVDRIRS